MRIRALCVKPAWTCVLVWACWAGPVAWAIDSTNRHAWAENVGWANAVPTNGGVTVCFNGTNGCLEGFAWGENIGWIKLGDNTGGPYNNSSATDWGVNLDEAGKLSGYAWGENVGWIKFDPTHSQVTIDKATGLFTGDAWGENIGWIRFHHGTVLEYHVRTVAFDKQPQGTPNWWLAQYSVAEDDDEGDGVPAWKEYVADTDPTNALSYLQIVAISNSPTAFEVFFSPSSSRRYYTLKRSDDLLSGSWTDISGQIDIQGAGGLDSMQDLTSRTQQFYRVDVKVSP